MKFTLRTIYYILVGIFYRKDIRIVHYKMEQTSYMKYPTPVYMNSKQDETIAEEIPDAIKKLQADENITKKDRINLNRLLFGIEYENRLWRKEKHLRLITCKYRWIFNFHMKIYNTFLSDLLIGKKPDPVYISDYNHAWWNILKLIKRYGMNYSNSIEHEKL